MVENLPSNAGNAGLVPGPGTKILHDLGQLSPFASISKPKCSRASWPQQEKPVGHNWREAPECSNEELALHLKDPVKPENKTVLTLKCI